MTTPDQPPPDQADRDRIRHDLGTNLFVEAGAGAGKTTSLVSSHRRVGRAPVSTSARIAAITFTEKAAADLRHRLREALRAEAAGSTACSHMPSSRLPSTNSTTPRSAPCTLSPGDCSPSSRSPPDCLPVSACSTSSRATSPSRNAGRTCSNACSTTRIPPRQRSTAVSISWRSVRVRQVRSAEHVPAGGDRVPRELGPRRGPRRSQRPTPVDPDVGSLLRLIDAACAIATPPGDTQADKVAELARLGRRLGDDPTTLGRLETIDAIHNKYAKSGKSGQRRTGRRSAARLPSTSSGNGSSQPPTRPTGSSTEARSHRVRVVGAILGRWVLESAELRAAEGTARVPRPARARPSARLDPTSKSAPRCTTDTSACCSTSSRTPIPIQLEIAVRLAAAPDDPAQNDDWAELVPLPGRLFIVGDPKQSIYRFRRADIAQYLRAAEQIGADLEPC